jgi:hypothetical protein
VSVTRTFGIAVLVGVLGLTVAGTSAARVCSERDADIADGKLEKLGILLDRGDQRGGWPVLRAVYDKYRQCDDGDIGEAFDDIVIRLITHRWAQTVEFLAGEGGSDGFQQFVLFHLEGYDAGCPLEAWKGAVESCPQALEGICSFIDRACVHTLEPE